ncbi:MAG: TolC family protein [Phycisphaerae bacterium]|nr:TolC family protein [Phycisphaerae bacterium]
MYLPGWPKPVVYLAASLLLMQVLGCESAFRGARESSANPQGRRAQMVAAARLAAEEPAATRPAGDVPSRMVAPATTQQVSQEEIIDRQIPDPKDLPDALKRQLDRAIEEINRNDRLTPDQKAQQINEKKANYEARMPGILKRIKVVDRPDEIRLSFADAMRRTLTNSYGIAAQSYNPAIETARVVEAEARFDEVFFANFQNNKQDRPSSSQLESNNSEVRTIESGIRKMLSTGMQVQVSYALNRSQTDLVFQTLNPTYFNSFIVQFQQPLLRGFGLDYNRAEIELTKLDREMSIEKLRRDVREIVFNVEQAYWQLLQARRVIGAVSQLLSDLEIIYNDLEKRLQAGYDVYRVQLSFIQSRIERHEAEFVTLTKRVRDAEDALKRLMNDPELDLSKNVGIIPVDVPLIEPLILDQIGEIAAGLANREELHEAKLAIEKAQIGVGVAKNQALPKLDVLFRYVVDGLGSNADRAFSQLSENDFHEYVVGLQFEWPIGNRGPEAKLRQARLQQAQAIAAHRDLIENVILEIQQAIRVIESEYEQVGPSYRWVTSSEEWADATKARQERRDAPNLQIELDSYESLSMGRRQLLDTLVRYNVALSNLERQKGTLLEYNNIVIRGAEDPRQMTPYRPVQGGNAAQ